jgi:SAM-dependent methyltransferase
MSEASPRVEPIDYVQRWRRLVRARNDQGGRLDPQHGRADFWAGFRAERFRRMTVEVQGAGADPFLDLIRPAITRATTILDVGAGAGRHALALAPQVARVIAVEPSPAMREQLAIGVGQLVVPNVMVIPAGWPEAQVEPADIVICSHVAYFTEEIEPFLRRLTEVTRKRLYIVVRFQQRELAMLDLFERVWGEPRCFEPTFADLFGAACQIEIWPNVTRIPYTTNVRFDSLDEAVQTVRADLLNPETAGVEDTIRAYLTEHMLVRDGTWSWDLPPMWAGVLWWENAT